MSTGTTTPDTPLAPSAEVPLRELAPAELGAWRGMLRVHSALVKALDAELLATHGLPLTSYEVLINLQAAPGRRRRMAELADGVLLSRSGTTRLVDRLERDGLLGGAPAPPPGGRGGPFRPSFYSWGPNKRALGGGRSGRGPRGRRLLFRG